ncbi:chemotaxis protein MotB [Pacificibacter maritimus]|uniref:Chemotaxis protein MotB n=1 Tax=Pacificibacter maritimus TaxID=762213 RepID=A0A3N4UIR4_9RHOB|nr:peptidoglycan -binding protein [Pacificibacter maritimus]RPE67149.1 chemotaxis protein MotB [Pacificibacter maritimus]
MAVLRRSSQRMSGSIWPGFVDAMTALLLVLMFVLTIFMVVQAMLRDTITGQESELNALSSEVEALARALGLEQQKTFGLEEQLGNMRATLSEARNIADAQTALITSLQADNAAQLAHISSFEAQVASLLAQRDSAVGRAEELTATVAELEAAKDRILSDQEALQLALAQARDEIDAAAEQARLAAARREALDALVAQLQSETAEKDAALAAALVDTEQATTALSQAEQDRLLDQAALQSLRDRLATSQDELTAMTLALEQERKEAEETLTLLAAAEAARKSLDQSAQEQLSEAQKQAALLATAKAALATETEKSAAASRKLALLNQQVAELRSQLSSLQAILDDRASRDAEANVQIDALTSRLNSALAQVAAEERRRAELEEAERKRLEAEAKQLENYRSEFFGRLREILGDREGVRIVGDRFVFSSEVLFDQGSATLANSGQAQIARVAQILSDVSKDIPAEIDWVIRVDGHTDRAPLSGTGEFKDNWELSQARALSVVRYMTDALGFPAGRLAAAGFGEYHPIAQGNSPAAYAQNRRIELKLTEK